MGVIGDLDNVERVCASMVLLGIIVLATGVVFLIILF
jgi:hypothetical protein